MDPQQAIEAVAGASVVYQCAAAGVHALAGGVPDAPGERRRCRRARPARRLVVVENLYMYGPTDGPMRETTPMAATGKKGSLGLASAATSSQRHAEGRLRVAIGRASDYYGPGAVNSAVGEQFFAAVARGKAVRWMGRLDQPHALSYLPDIAAGLVTLGEHPEADGEVWHLPVSRRP